MDYRGVKKKTYKDIKKEVVRDTALNVGYYPKVLTEINDEVLLDTIKEISLQGWIREDTNDVELRNMIVTESVRKMSYQEFKDIADNFFSFVPDNEEEYYKASKLEITRENYDYLVNNTKKAFGLERKLEEIENEINSLDNKIYDLETKVIPNENKVVGVDLENEQILLLKAPYNTYIDEDVILSDKVLNDYKSSYSDYRQILDPLIERYSDIRHIYYEYTLNNDTYRGLPDIDFSDIEEIDYDDIPVANFTTHKEYYDYATQFESFRNKYKDYEEYIYERFEFIYSREYMPDYSEEVLKEKRKEIDDILEKNGDYLVLQTVYGYSQGEVWKIGYLAEQGEDIDTINEYIEHYLGAWYRGSLTELQTIPFDAFEGGRFNGEIEDVQYIDTSLLYYHSTKETLDKIKSIYPEYKNFKIKEELDKQENKNKNKDISL